MSKVIKSFCYQVNLNNIIVNFFDLNFVKFFFLNILLWNTQRKLKKRMEKMQVRLDQYEQDFGSKKFCSPGAAVSVVSGAEEQQESDLKTLRKEFEGLKTLVSTLVPKIEKIEKNMDDQEQCSRSNCLIVYGVKNIPKRGEYLDNENFICSELNKKLTLNPPTQASDLDIAHPLPSRKGDAMIVKFL